MPHERYLHELTSACLTRKRANVSLSGARFVTTLAAKSLVTKQHPYLGGNKMTRVTRRKFLKASGAGALAAKTTGMAGILAANKAPAYAQTTTLHWLKWNDYVPAGDEILRKSMLPEAKKALGFKINMETIGLNDLQPRATASIQAQGGADIIMIFDNKAQLYADSVA